MIILINTKRIDPKEARFICQSNVMQSRREIGSNRDYHISAVQRMRENMFVTPVIRQGKMINDGAVVRYTNTFEGHYVGRVQCTSQRILKTPGLETN